MQIVVATRARTAFRLLERRLRVIYRACEDALHACCSPAPISPNPAVHSFALPMAPSGLLAIPSNLCTPIPSRISDLFAACPVVAIQPC